jgi:hypothetical protein
MQKQLASQKLLKTTTTKHVFFKISNYQKWFEITQFEIESHKIYWTPFTHKLIEN